MTSQSPATDAADATMTFDPLTVFGLVAVTLMLLFYAFEDNSPWCILGFAIACAMGSVYGFLQGAWPFGLVEGVWTFIALKRWQNRRLAGRPIA
jgi:hypothetical protein